MFTYIARWIASNPGIDRIRVSLGGGFHDDLCPVVFLHASQMMPALMAAPGRQALFSFLRESQIGQEESKVMVHTVM